MRFMINAGGFQWKLLQKANSSLSHSIYRKGCEHVINQTEFPNPFQQCAISLFYIKKILKKDICKNWNFYCCNIAFISYSDCFFLLLSCVFVNHLVTVILKCATEIKFRYLQYVLILLGKKGY